MPILFISDLHLDADRPDIIEEFNRKITGYSGLEALYILGDFVEYWIGDDDNAHRLDAAFVTLRQLHDRNIPVYLMHGNRDFLFGKAFADTYGLELLPDPTVIDLYGEPTLLMHGDTLCTDDTAYQSFRLMVRDPAWQKKFLQQPLNIRRNIVKDLRETSKTETQNKTNEIMDVNQQTVATAMREHEVRRLIHGHTHRPAIHRFVLDGTGATRIVLGDWYTQSSLLEFHPESFRLTAHNQSFE